MNTIQPGRVGMVFAALFGGGHLLWSLLVAAGWAQPLVDFLFQIHFIKPVYQIQPFHPGTALLLIAVTSGVGFGGGWILGVVWNKLHRQAG